MKENIKVLFIGVVIGIFLIIAWPKIWRFERNLKWNNGYEDKVEQKIKEMVKPEALK